MCDFQIRQRLIVGSLRLEVSRADRLALLLRDNAVAKLFITGTVIRGPFKRGFAACDHGFCLLDGQAEALWIQADEYVTFANRLIVLDQNLFDQLETSEATATTSARTWPSRVQGASS